MTTINRSAIVPYSAEQMYALVNAVESYPEFLPWCKSATILSHNDDEMRATLDLAVAGFQKSFSTCNRLQQNKMIEIRLLDGPFRHLEGFWRFEELLDGKSKVSFDLEFEFVNKLFSIPFSAVFQQIAHSLVDAFTQRAATLYGTK